MAFMKALPAQTEPLHDAGAKVLHEHVRAGEKLVHDREIARPLEVERDALLAPVHRQEISRYLAEEGSDHAREITALGVLHLHDPCAEIREGERAKRTCEDPGEVDDRDARQGAFRAHGDLLASFARRPLTSYE
jgi:hypothetical protein